MDNGDKPSKDVYLAILNKISGQVEEAHKQSKEAQEQSKKTQECVNKLDKKLDLTRQEMKYEIKAINKLDEQQNKELAEHIEGVNTLKAMHKDMREHFDTRMTKLEEPRKALSLLKKWLIGAGTVAGAIFAIGRVLGWF